MTIGFINLFFVQYLVRLRPQKGLKTNGRLCKTFILFKLIECENLEDGNGKFKQPHFRYGMPNNLVAKAANGSW